VAGALGEVEPMKYFTVVNKQQFEIEILPDGQILVNGTPREVDFLQLDRTEFSMIKDNQSLEVVIDTKENGQYDVLVRGRLYDAQVLDERAMLMMSRKGGLKSDSGEVLSPMPGLIVEIKVEKGQTVAEGQTLVILESMKMQNELKSNRAGVVQQVIAVKGQTVDKNALLVIIGDE
jgi:biotin carboxyl carrier protein